VVEPIVGPHSLPTVPGARAFALPKLARHLITLDDGHQVGVAICGRGVPLVVAHGFLAEGILYAQTLSRIVDLGFKVVAIDTAGHGGTLGLPTGADTLDSYTKLLARVLDHLGIERAVLAGHSMGGRLVTELAATEPHRAIAVLLLDAIVGDPWDRMVTMFRIFPPFLGTVGFTLFIDTLTTVPMFRDPAQARKLGRLMAPTIVARIRRPWRLVGPAVSILRSQRSRWMLDKIAHDRIPLFAIHGDRDFVVPIKTGRSAARRARGELVIVHGGTHSWLLKDPESLPAIMHRLMRGRLGTAVLKAQLVRGVDPNDATVEEVESAFYEAGSLALRLTPDASGFRDTEELHRRPRYRFSVHID
jgi:pimeloyl-ACP methyl ester carboxylesterase